MTASKFLTGIAALLLASTAAATTIELTVNGLVWLLCTRHREDVA